MSNYISLDMRCPINTSVSYVLDQHSRLTAICHLSMMNLMKEKKITIDSLARMVAKGFSETAKTAEVNFRFNKIDDRLERIEKLVLANHKMRIERLEEEVKYLKELLAVK